MSNDNSSNVIMKQIIDTFYELQLVTAIPVAAMFSLILVIQKSKASTWMRLEQELRLAIKELSMILPNDRSSLPYNSACELFMKYITRSFVNDIADFQTCKAELVRLGNQYAIMSQLAKEKISHIGNSFIRDGCTILIHGESKIVFSLIQYALQTKQFKLIITEGYPRCDGRITAKDYEALGASVQVIPDSAVAATLEKIDLVLVGAEGVMENGGIINKLGTYQISIVAKALGKPFYVAVETYKFARLYPLSQQDAIQVCQTNDQISRKDILIDFTPAEYITLLFTDMGVFTPAAVSDELIKLYQ